MAQQYELIKVGRSQLAFCPMEQMESISVGLWFKTGSRYENLEIHGAAHFLEHMLFKGTKKRNALQITEAIESKGGDLNAFTSEEMTCYYARTGAEYLPLVLEILFDMLWNSNFPVDEIKRERGVILEEIRMYEDQPHIYILERLNERLWPDNAVGQTIIGTPESVSRIKRQELMEFWRRNYRPKSLIVSIAGGVELQQVKENLLPYVQSPRNASAAMKWTPVAARRRRKVDTLGLDRPIQQSHVAIGFNGLARSDSRRYTEKLLSVILGENMSSRLFQVIREKHGLAYAIHTSATHHVDGGAFYIQMGLDRENLSAAFQLIAKELQRIAKKAPSANELKRAKDYTIGQMKLSLENTSSRMMWMGECSVGLGYILQPQAVVQELMSVTTEQIRKLAQELFVPGNMVVTAMGPGVDQVLVNDASNVFNLSLGK